MKKRITVHINLTAKALINSSIKLFVGCIVLFLHVNGFSQSEQDKNTAKTALKMSVEQDLSFDQVATLSRSYQDKALWFKEMPHFNRDSTVIYFDKAVLLLQNSKPLQYER